MTCSRLWEIDAVADGRIVKDDPSLQRHLLTCAECRERDATIELVRGRLRALSPPEPEELSLRRLRARVLRDAAAPEEAFARQVRVRIAVALVGMLVVVGAIAGLRRRMTSFREPIAGASSSAAAETVAGARGASVASAREASSVRSQEGDPGASRSLAGTVTAAEGARWLQGRDGEVERVSLLDGEIAVNVRKQRQDERFFVDLPDGVLEVRGTTFAVTVREGSTREVRVSEGTVDVRLRQVRATLTAGQSWKAAAGSILPAPKRGSRPPTGGDADDTAYEAATALYGKGQYALAADAFRRFAVSHARSPMADDATYLRALSLARAGDVEGAAAVARQHLQVFPASFHRKDAAILAARPARDRGDCEQVRTLLAPWLANGDPFVLRELGSCSP